MGLSFWNILDAFCLHACLFGIYSHFPQLVKSPLSQPVEILRSIFQCHFSGTSLMEPFLIFQDMPFIESPWFSLPLLWPNLIIVICVFLLTFLLVCKLPKHWSSILLYFTVSHRFYIIFHHTSIWKKFELKSFQKIPTLLSHAEVSKLYIILEM